MRPGPRRLAVVLSHPTQYYSPWFRWLAAHTDLRLRVFYLWTFGVERTRDAQFGREFAWDVDLLSGYESEFVPNASPRPGPEHFRGFDNPGLPARLEAWAPEAVLLFGYNWASHLRAAAWAWRRRVPVVFRGDSHFIGRPPPPWRRRLPLSLLFRSFRAFACVGRANRAYYEALGVPAHKLFFVPHAVDDRLFDPERADHREAAARLRGELGLAPGAPVVLYAGKLLPAKQPRELLEAFLACDTRAALVFVGDGEERPALEARAASAPPGRVRFLPFANQSEMPARYLLADVFALPSRGLYETWGLAVNEAMHMGVPALVSDRVGCQQDLVFPGETGWVFPAEDPARLRGALRAALDELAGDGGRERLRRSARARIAGYTYPRAAEGLLQALDSLRR